jgi:hypothetical protein
MPRIMHTTHPTIVSPRRGSNEVPDTPEAVAHAHEAREIEAELVQFGIKAERVAPTRDGRGHVRLSFTQVRQLLGL